MVEDINSVGSGSGFDTNMQRLSWHLLDLRIRHVCRQFGEALMRHFKFRIWIAYQRVSLVVRYRVYVCTVTARQFQKNEKDAYMCIKVLHALWTMGCSRMDLARAKASGIFGSIRVAKGTPACP